MKRLLSLYLAFLAASLFSCKSKPSSQEMDQITKSYGIMYTAFAATKQTQENFFAEATHTLGIVKYNKDAVVDTRKLKLLLDSAQEAGQERITLLSLADEIDDEIKYKEISLKFVRLVDTLYKTEFIQFINILESNANNRFEKCQLLLFQRMRDMKKAMDNCHDAGKEVREKYHIPEPKIIN